MQLSIAPNVDALVGWAQRIWDESEDKTSTNARVAQGILAECGVFVSGPVHMRKKVSLVKRVPVENPVYVVTDRIAGVFETQAMFDDYGVWMMTHTIMDGIAQNDLQCLAWAFRKLSE
jgi:hypothetical protein